MDNIAFNSNDVETHDDGEAGLSPAAIQNIKDKLRKVQNKNQEPRGNTNSLWLAKLSLKAVGKKKKKLTTENITIELKKKKTMEEITTA